MIYQCPDGFTYGSTCNLRCMGKFPLVGNDSIVCEKNSTNEHPSTYWNKGPRDPYCKSENNIFTLFINRSKKGVKSFTLVAEKNCSPTGKFGLTERGSTVLLLRSH